MDLTANLLENKEKLLEKGENLLEKRKHAAITISHQIMEEEEEE